MDGRSVTPEKNEMNYLRQSKESVCKASCEVKNFYDLIMDMTTGTRINATHKLGIGESLKKRRPRNP